MINPSDGFLFWIHLVDLNDQIHMVDVENYKNTVCDETWRVISELANEVKDRKLRVSFFNSTPQGGGGKVYIYYSIVFHCFDGHACFKL